MAHASLSLRQPGPMAHEAGLALNVTGGEGGVGIKGSRQGVGVGGGG
jgi:hypothetical protein